MVEFRTKGKGTDRKVFPMDKKRGLKGASKAVKPEELKNSPSTLY